MSTDDGLDFSWCYSATHDDREALDGWMLRDASLEDVEHYFIYHADWHASLYLDGPDGDDGLRRAA